MRRELMLVAAMAVLTTVTAGSPASAAPVAAAPTSCDGSSWTAGSVDLCAGALVYRDYLYDDHGANNGTPGSSPGRLSRPSGDDRHPAGQESTTDIVDLTLRIVGDRLEATFELAAMYEVDTAVAALAIDTDADETTGGGSWTVADRPLNVESAGWEVLEFFSAGDPATNVITGSLPLPAGDRWRVQAAVARADTNKVMNVAFRGTDEQASANLVTTYDGTSGSWFEDKQAAALADGDISQFGHVVEVAEMRNGVTRPAPLEPGLHERVYTSAHTRPPGEGWSERTPVPGRQKGGIANQGGYFPQAFHFFGRYQPYGIYVPQQPGPHGIQLALHGYNANHSSLVNQPGMQQRFGEELNRLIVVPLGRGPHGFMSDIAELDLLEVLADVERTYPVDTDRLFAGGYSMGGYSALRLATLYPDRFAGMVNWVGFVGDSTASPAGNPGLAPAGAVGYPLDLLGSLRHVPSAHLYGANDELEPMHNQLALRDRLLASDALFEQFTHAPPAEHFTFGVADDWRKEAEYTRDLRRVTRPARLTFRTDEWFGNDEYGIRHDQAYWVSALRGREDGYVDVDAMTYACGGSVPETHVVRRQGPDPLPWTSERREVVGEQSFAAEPRLELTLANVQSLVLDTEAICLADRDIAYTVVTDGPVTVQFADGRTLPLSEAGEHTGVLDVTGAVAGSAPPAAGSGSPDGTPTPVSAAQPLPATGGSAAGAAAALGLLLAALAVRRRSRLSSV